MRLKHGAMLKDTWTRGDHLHRFIGNNGIRPDMALDIHEEVMHLLIIHPLCKLELPAGILTSRRRILGAFFPLRFHCARDRAGFNSQQTQTANKRPKNGCKFSLFKERERRAPMRMACTVSFVHNQNLKAASTPKKSSCSLLSPVTSFPRSKLYSAFTSRF